MSRIKRRHFLQFAGSALTAIGLSQLDLENQSLRYSKVLAQNVPRKLALLVGIDKYPNSSRFTALDGCVYDTKLQKALLMGRFGFQEEDIVILTDAQATREEILKTFKSHLIEQAQPGDVVVFHFSGHGSRVFDPNPISNDGRNSTFVPYNDRALTSQSVVDDITGHTLFLLRYILGQKTQNITFVLDSCHSGGGTRGNVRVRAARNKDENGDTYKLSAAEREYQQELLAELKMSPEDFQEKRKQNAAPGVVIASAQADQPAADYPFSGFVAGAFTYLLTQYLWQRTEDVERAIARVSNKVDRISAQDPYLDVAASSQDREKPVYFLEPQRTGADALVTAVRGNQATIWLGGMSRNSLYAIDEAILAPISDNEEVKTKVQITSRKGLEAQATVTDGTVKAGDLLQEYARMIPKDLQLKIGLDVSLGAEMVTAQTELKKMNRIQPIPAPTPNSTYSDNVHYILSRMTEEYRKLIQGSSLPPEGSICLFTPSLEVLPNSWDEPGESVASAVTRLDTKFQSLFAAHLVKTTLNAESSHLGIKATMRLEGQEDEIIAQSFTVRGEGRGEEVCDVKPCKSGASRGEQVQLGNVYQFLIENQGSSPLYIGIILIDPSRGVAVLFPNDFVDEGEDWDATKLEASRQLLIPDPEKDNFSLEANFRKAAEFLIVASKHPLSNALARVRNWARTDGMRRGIVSRGGNDAVNLVTDLVVDLGNSRGEDNDEAAFVVKQRVREMAALSIPFKVV
ncbi:caspase family protein [Lusitaniella coriacea LEGE 07157]|uniref:Caspase family protein n=1 Tax=Lusitaniella coriacea LEGE 07157 TaxID=945747 RepID=A0A8J7DL72_9CYAN|nr:caspase family protein [Lusitaniella coriacea]MBE9114338.1 caspase family protein [Lusitaniella coriacea LEGE 07157]